MKILIRKIGEKLMVRRKFLNYTLLFLVSVSIMIRSTSQIQPVSALPISPTDETKVPHYFGPYPNWANSPYMLSDVAVEIIGNGAGATAVASVGANGAITGIIITSPGSDYTTATVTITGAGTGATADASVTTSGVVTAIIVDNAGSGYTQPVVTFTGGGGTGAIATAYGGVDAVVLNDPGSGYSFPTVDFDLPDDPNGVQARGHVLCNPVDCTPANPGDPITIIGVQVDNPGSGYSTAPNVVIRDGTLFDPISPPVGFIPAIATTTLSISVVTVNTYGAEYTSAPSVTIIDQTGTGSGAVATAFTDFGAVTAINLTAGGSGYVTAGGIKKFTDPLPGLCVPPACPTGGKYIPLGVPEVKSYGGGVADEYMIGLVQYRTSFSSSLPPTLVRGYVQIETPANAGISQHFPLTNANLDPALPDSPVLINGSQAYGVTPPQYLGPTIAATRDRPVRIVFYNLLPTGSGGDLFLPTDSTLMGSGMGPTGAMAPDDLGTVTDMVRNPLCSEYPKDATNCFKDNRATLHLHGGITPWISDGTPHQWITPDGEDTIWPEGVSVENVPDMDVCTTADDGCQTFYYTNQQSARLMFYHDHAWGITRLNVYAGEAAGYLISDNTEKALINSGTIPGAADTIPLIIQDRTFVPDAAQLAAQDPTWDVSRWGGYGNFWYHHVYMPAQNPGDPGGMSAYGRWMYGPWFWPPAADTVHGPIANPYYNMDPKGPDGIPGTADDWTTPLLVPCNIDDPATWQYQTDPFCEPEQIPGTPNISVGMEQFNDTPIVNGVAYPTLTLEPRTYRLRFLSAANDRFFNFQWYVGDPNTASTSMNSLGQVIGATEVALNPTELAAAQLDPNIFPTPDTSISLPGPDWIQIGTEGGFLPAPVVVDGQQVTTWIIDPTRFDVGNVDQHSLLLAPAERADVIVDFSQFAGQTLILYNDAPAAFPARVSSYDYYTGAPDLSPVGAPTILPGYGPNTRTILQVKVAANPPAPAFNLSKLQTAFRHTANATGVFESGQHPIIVGQAAYNSAYGTNFAASSNCNAPGSTLQRCDGYVRVNDTSTFGFNTLRGQNTKMTMPLQPKAIHDEMNATTFDEFGRMQANLGVEAQPPVPGAQNVVLYPFVNPATELIDATGLPVGDINVTPISSATDGTQIWRITHNGVDTHPIHFHLYDVQLLNRVTWDNIIIPPDATELGWKDTVRISPLEDTIVALRPVIPSLPWDLPNSIRPLSPMLPLGSDMGFNNVDPQGNPTVAITNTQVNFGWEYVYHCHILSHEEMDMMRPVSVAVPPVAPCGLVFEETTKILSWIDTSLSETAFVVQKSTDGINWTDVGQVDVPLDVPNTSGGLISFTDESWVDPETYRVYAQNTVGDTLVPGFPTVTVKSGYAYLGVNTPPAAFNKSLPANGATNQLLNPTLSWGASSGVTYFEYCYDTTNDNACSGWTNSGTATSVGLSGLSTGTTYYWHVRAVNCLGTTYANNSNTAFWSFTTGVPPAAFNKSLPANGATDQPLNPTLSWGASSGATSYEYCFDTTNDNACSGWTTNGPVTSVGLSGLSASTTYYWHVRAVNSFGNIYANGSSTAFWSFTTGIPPAAFNKTLPAYGATSQPLNPTLSWGASSGVTYFEYCYDTTNNNTCIGWTNNGTATSVGLSGLSTGTTYYWHVRAVNSIGTTYANGSSIAFWNFTTGVPPAAFNKSLPANGATDQPLNPNLWWGASSGVTSYEYCYDTTNDNACSGWANNGTATSRGLSRLIANTTYYWHVRAINSFGTTYTNGSSSAFWSFTTGNFPSVFYIYLPIINK
jgi:FtsP/CotA-like multicopper oxidase with cupredoxin domain